MPQHVTSGTPEFKAAQRRALVALESEPGASLTRSEYERLTGVGRSQAAYDLAELVAAGLLVRVGGGRSTRYVLAHEPAAQRQWTPDRIRRELDAFCADRNAWPTATEFKTAGHGDLYVAASRYGGVAHWASELGLERSGRSVTVDPAPTPFRRKLAWAVAGVLATAAVAASAAVATFLVAAPGSRHVASPSTTQRQAGATTIVDESRHPGLAAETVHAATKARRPATHVERRTPRVVRQQAAAPRPAGTSRISQISYAVRTRSSAAATGTRSWSSASPPPSGPAPLPAPSDGTSPSPLKAP